MLEVPALSVKGALRRSPRDGALLGVLGALGAVLVDVLGDCEVLGGVVGAAGGCTGTHRVPSHQAVARQPVVVRSRIHHRPLAASHTGPEGSAAAAAAGADVGVVA